MYFLLGSPQLSSCLIFQTLEADNLNEITVAYAGPIALDQSCFHCHQWHCWETDELPQSWGLLGHSIVVQQVPRGCSGNRIHHWPSSPSEGRTMVSVLQTFCCVSQSSTSWQVWILYCPKKGKRKWLKKGWNWNQTRIKKETAVFWKANLRGRIFITNRPVLRSKNENDQVMDSLRKEHKRVPCSQSSGAVREVCGSNLTCKPKHPSLFLTFTETCLD